MGPTLFVDVSYNSGIVCSNQNMMGLGRGICENGELHLERSDRDS